MRSGGSGWDVNDGWVKVERYSRRYLCDFVGVVTSTRALGEELIDSCRYFDRGESK